MLQMQKAGFLKLDISSLKYSNFLLKKKIRELKNSILWQHEPVCKAFVLGAKDSPTDADTS